MARRLLLFVAVVIVTFCDISSVSAQGSEGMSHVLLFSRKRRTKRIKILLAGLNEKKNRTKEGRKSLESSHLIHFFFIFMEFRQFYAKLYVSGPPWG